MSGTKLNECVIWGEPAEGEMARNEWLIRNSPRAGGRYAINLTATPEVATLTTDGKLRLTSWLVRQRRAGEETPQIDTNVLDQIRTMPKMSYSDRASSALLFLGDHLSIQDFLAVLYPPAVNTLHLMANTECASVEEAQILLRLMAEGGLLRTAANQAAFSPTPDGWRRYEELKTKTVNSAQAFVAMWFNSVTDEPYENGIKRAIYDSGYDPVRIDKKHHLNKIDDEIIAEIRRSRFLVADFTCEPKQLRGGVYFETGFAMGLNIPIIWTCRNTSLDDLHFDTRQYPHIVWKDSGDLNTQLKARIGALIGDGPKRRS